MITQNLSMKDLLSVNKESDNNIFRKVCSLGHFKLLKFLESMMSRKELVEALFFSNNYDQKCIEAAIGKSHSLVAKYLMDMKEVQDRYKNNDPLTFRLCFWLFIRTSNPELIDYILSALQISKKKVVQMLSYKCPKQPMYKRGANTYHFFAIIGRVTFYGSFDHLQRLIAVIGKQAFIDNVFNLNGWNRDAMHYAVKIKNMKIIEYILLMDEIKEKYMSDNNLLFRMVTTLNEYITNKEIVQYVVDALGLTEAKLSELNAFQAIDIEKIIPFTK